MGYFCFVFLRNTLLLAFLIRFSLQNYIFLKSYISSKLTLNHFILFFNKIGSFNEYLVTKLKQKPTKNSENYANSKNISEWKY